MALVDVDDRTALARAYGTSWVSALPSVGEALLAEEPGTRTACRTRAEELSAERCADRYLELYGELLEG